MKYLIEADVHILGQFRRNWSYLPGVFNLWFRSEINLGASLRVVATKMQADKGCDFAEEDAATAAAGATAATMSAAVRAHAYTRTRK